MDPVLIIVLVSIVLIIMFVLLAHIIKNSKIKIDEYISYSNKKRADFFDSCDKKVYEEFLYLKECRNKIEYYNKNESLYIKKLKALRLVKKEEFLRVNEIFQRIKREYEQALLQYNNFSLNAAIDDEEVNVHYFTDILNLLKPIERKNEFLKHFISEKVYGIENKDNYLMFYKNRIIALFPEQIFTYRFKDLTYSFAERIDVVYSPGKGADIVGKTWEHVRKDGNRDLRYSDNARMYKVRKIVITFDTLVPFVLVYDNLEKFNKFHNTYKGIYGRGITQLGDLLHQYIKHSMFGYGQIIDVNNMSYVVKFTDKTQRKFGKMYADFKIVDKEEYDKALFEEGKKNVKVKYIYHPHFGYGEIVSQNESNYSILFDGNITRTIAISYSGLKPITKEEYDNKALKEDKVEEDNNRYVYHKLFGYGIIIEEEESNYIIKFKKFSKKTISKTYDNLLTVTKAQYDLDDSIPEPKNIIKEEKTTNSDYKHFNIGDLMTHPQYGKGIVENENEKDYSVLFEDGVEKLIEKAWVEKQNNIIPLTAAPFDYDSLKPLDFVFTKKKGYGQILDYSEKVIILWKNYKIIEYPLDFLKVIQVVRHSNVESLSLEKFDFVVSPEKELGYIKDFRDNLALIEYFNKYENSWERLDQLKRATDVEIRDFYDSLNPVSQRSKRLFLSLNREVYSKEDSFIEYGKIFKKTNSFDDVRKEFKNCCFTFKDGLFIKNKYNNLEDYLTVMMLKEPVHHYDYSISSQKYDYYLNKLCNNHYCIKYEGDIYFTMRKMIMTKISLKDFDDLKVLLINYLSEKIYASINQIVDDIKCNILDKIKSTDAIRNIINTFDEIKERKVGKIYIYHLKDDTNKNDFLDNLLENELLSCKQDSIDVGDFTDILNEKYKFDFEYDDLITLMTTIDSNNIIYCKETERIYKNKETYYKEVFDYDIKKN